MWNNHQRILLVDDNPADRALAMREVQTVLPEVRFEEIRSPEDLQAAIAHPQFDIVITDYQLNWSDGLQVFEQVRAACPGCPVIMFTGSGNEEIAVEGLKRGLADYVPKKPRQYAVLGTAVLRALEREQERQTLRALQEERHRINEALRLNEKFAELGRLAGVIAHEINNPLESVGNLLYLLRESGRLDDELAGYTASAEAELGRIAHITRQTLSFYRESSRPAQTRLPDLLDGLLAMYVQKINSHVRVVREYSQVEPVLVFTSQIRQVFSNLIGNALDAMAAESGVLRLRVRPSVLWTRRAVRGVRVTISDTGPGIAQKDRSHIFQAFFTTKGEKGTGLGLWVSQAIVMHHHGTIHVCSRTLPDSHGTVFSVFLPYDAMPAQLTPADAQPQPAEAI